MKQSTRKSICSTVPTKLDCMRGECVHLLREVGCRDCTNLPHGCVTSRHVVETQCALVNIRTDQYELWSLELMNGVNNVQHRLHGNGQVEVTGTLVTIRGLMVLNADEIHGTALRNQ